MQQNAERQNKRAPNSCSEPFALEINPGGDLRSRVVTNAVSSALRSLTAVFGMGTGVTPAVRPPETCRLEARGWRLEKTDSKAKNQKRSRNCKVRARPQRRTLKLKEAGEIHKLI